MANLGDLFNPQNPLYDFARLQSTDPVTGNYLYGDNAESPFGSNEADYLSSIRRFYKIPSQVNDSQVKQWSQTELPALIEKNRKDSGGFLDQMKEFGGPIAYIGASALGGPVAGSIAAANGSGATQSLGVDPAITSLAALGYGAYNKFNSGGLGSTPNADVAGSEYGVAGTAPTSPNYWSNTFAANNTGTMTDASNGPSVPSETSAGGNGMFDDFSGQWIDAPTDTYGANWMSDPTLTGNYNSPWSTNPSTADLGGNIDASTGGMAGNNLFQQVGDYVKKYGGTALQALQILARGAPGVAGAVAANRQAGSLSALSDKYMAMGAPSRSRYEESFAPGFTMMNDPGYKDALDQTTKATLHGMSVNGDPAGSPNAWAQTLSDVNSKFAYPALQTYRTGNANAGGLATFNAAAPGAAGAAIDARGNVLNSLGAATNDIFNPRQSLADLLRAARV